mgnify:CR=1 FL=1
MISSHGRPILDGQTDRVCIPENDQKMVLNLFGRQDETECVTFGFKLLVFNQITGYHYQHTPQSPYQEQK